MFKNLSKGIVASGADLQAAFGTSDEAAVCRIILERGELQVGERERDAEYELMFRDVVNLLCEKCVNPTTKRPYTFGVLERAMRELHVRVDLRRSAKVQSLELVKLINEKSIPIQRARMKLRAEVRTAARPGERAETGAPSAGGGGVGREAAAAAAEAEADGDEAPRAAPGANGKPKRRRRRRRRADGEEEGEEGGGEAPAAGPAARAAGPPGGGGRLPPDASAADVVGFFEREFGVEVLVNSRQPARGEGDGGAPPGAEGGGELLVLVFLIEPGFFRQISQIVQSDLHGRLEVLEIAALEEAGAAAGPADAAAGAASIDAPMREMHIGGRAPAPKAAPSSKLRCTTCQLSFGSPAEHREHFRSDLHKVNVKRKAAGEPPVGEEECEAILMMMATESDRRRREMADFM